MGEEQAANLAASFGGTGVTYEALADGDAPAIYDASKRVAFLRAGAPTVTVTTAADRAVASIVNGFEAPEAVALFTDQRFRTAVALYAAAHFEESGSAKLLTLSMAVEVLSPVVEKHQVVLDLLDSWKPTLAAAKEASAADADALAGLESLERELMFRRDASIRSRVRSYVMGALEGSDGAEDAAKMAVRAYDARSRLVHEGTLDPADMGEAIANLQAVLKRVFQRRLALPAV
jgi:hypothetical protein